MTAATRTTKHRRGTWVLARVGERRTRLFFILHEAVLEPGSYVAQKYIEERDWFVRDYVKQSSILNDLPGMDVRYRNATERLRRDEAQVRQET
jgi:hypothetical protein